MKKIVIALVAVMSLAVLSVGMASAAGTCTKSDPANGIYCCNGVQTSINFNCDPSTGNSVTSLLLYIIDFLSVGVGVAVVIGIVLGGVTYVMSDGDSGKAKEGQEMITNSIIGLFLFLFLFAAANFFIPGGLFTAK